jgi:hypothetical protein
MLADPQTITIDSVGVDFPATGRAIGKSVYTSEDGTMSFEISHQPVSGGTRNRRLIRLNVETVAADPFNDSLNKPYSMSTYLVIDVPTVGFSAADVEDYVLALAGWLTSSNVADVLGGQS